METETSVARTTRSRLDQAVRRHVIARPILIVDDDPRSRLLSTAGLAELGLSNPMVEAASGEQAMATMRGCIGVPHLVPALVLLDLHMPGRSGRDVLAWMRGTPELEHVPVIVLTSDDDIDSVTSLYKLGVRSYLVKPVGFDAVAAVVRDLGLPWMLT